MPHLDGRRHTLADLYHENTEFEFLHRLWRWALVSGLFLAVGLAAFGIRGGLNFGIDFTGGTAFQVTAQGANPSAAGVRAVIAEAGVPDAKIVIVGGTTLRVQTKDLTAPEQAKVRAAIAGYADVAPTTVSISDVSATWGDQVSSKAWRALLIFFVVIALYLAIRFEFKMSVAAIFAVVHDILITVGIYAITGFEVAPATVVAFLTILGFSLYDTVVVFDKIKENESSLGSTIGESYTDMANRSLNQVLMRSINTSFVALLPVASLLVVGVWIMGALSLRDFGLALFVGLMSGAYSSIFVATPILAWWKEREPRNRMLAGRAERRSVRVAASASGDASLDSVPAAIVAPKPRRAKGQKRR